MDQNEQTESATVVAVAVFDLFQVVGDETVYDVNGVIDLIQAYGDRRVRAGWRRPRRAKIVRLRIAQGALR